MAAQVKPSKKSFPAILVVIALIGVVAIGYMTSRPTEVLKLPDGVPTLQAKGVLKGDSNALVQVIEFADFECPGCGQFATVTEPDVMARLVATGEVAFRFIDFPLEGHLNAVAAHNAAACANEQGKFWEMHDRIFLNQHRWNTQATKKPKGVLEGLAKDAGLDMGQWNDCYDSGRMLEQISANRTQGMRLRVNSTPTFIINDQMVAEVLTYDRFRELVTMAKVQRMADSSAKTGKAVTAPKRP